MVAKKLHIKELNSPKIKNQAVRRYAGALGKKVGLLSSDATMIDNFYS